MVEGICDGLAGLKEGEGFRGRGRDQLFFLLFLYISGSVNQRPLNEYASVFKLLTFYDEPEPLPVPEMSKKGKISQHLKFNFLYLEEVPKVLAVWQAFILPKNVSTHEVKSLSHVKARHLA